MPYFVIFGKPNCPNFRHAAFIAQYLSERLPSFFYKKIEKLPTDWALFLDDLNHENKWFLTESPVIWKEISMWGGKKYLLGGLSEFWEHVYSYYGLESIIPKRTLQELAVDNEKFFREKLMNEDKKDIRYVTILGASSPCTCLLLHDLVNIKSLRKSDGIIFKFYDHHQTVDSKKYHVMVEALIYFNETKLFGNNFVEICETKEDAIINSDLIIHLEDFFQRGEEEVSNWLERCNYRMKILADTLIAAGNRSAKIILASDGPVCFLATCLWTSCANKFPNIVALTANKGFPFIKSISEKTGIQVDRISAPPVWGYIGLNCFVDVKNTLFKADIYRPYRGSLTAPKGSTLPLGVINADIRLMSYMIKDATEIERDVEEKTKELLERLERAPIFSKIRAVVSLVKLWFSEEIGDEVISLGVPSNRSFQIPKGVFFSQPVHLDETRMWVPYSNFPLMDEDTKARLNLLIRDTKKHLRECGLIDDRDLYFDDDPEAYQKYLSRLALAGEGEGEGNSWHSMTYCCSEDGCNSAPTTKSQSMLLLFLTIASILMIGLTLTH